MTAGWSLWAAFNDFEVFAQRALARVFRALSVLPVGKAEGIEGRGGDDAEERVGRRAFLTPPLDAATIRRIGLVPTLLGLAGRCDDSERRFQDDTRSQGAEACRRLRGQLSLG